MLLCPIKESLDFIRQSSVLPFCNICNGKGTTVLQLLQHIVYRMATLPANYWQITDDRYNWKATILVSQLSTSDRYNVFKSELITEVCLDRIVHKAMKFCLFGESLRKSINFADNAEDYQRTERISPELVNGYRPEYAK